jgi:hypothetical protein
MVDVVVLRRVWMTLVKASNAHAPRSLREQWDTLRASTAGRSLRSARLLVASTSFGAETAANCLDPAALPLHSATAGYRHRAECGSADVV